jgi:hypothetical protein
MYHPLYAANHREIPEKGPLNSEKPRQPDREPGSLRPSPFSQLRQVSQVSLPAQSPRRVGNFFQKQRARS